MEDKDEVQYHVIAGYDLVETTSLDMQIFTPGGESYAAVESRPEGVSGTVGLALSSGSLLLEASSIEPHGSTSSINGGHRLSAVFYSHKTH